MRHKSWIATLGAVWILTGCMGGTSSEEEPASTGLPSHNIVQQAKDLTLTIYVDGFSKDGYQRMGLFGENNTLLKYKDTIEESGLSILDEGDTQKGNLLVGTDYYGDTAPDYYSEQDKEELERITETYGGGIPRYAFIVAKYTEHIMKERSATEVNFVSASMGSLVVRWLVEKNLLNLSSDKKIAKWYSLEGVLKGNYPASEIPVDTLSELIDGKSPDITQMSYDWVNSHFNTPSNYYKDIQLGYESSTNDNLESGFLTKYLYLQNKFYPNDGYQLVKDTYLTIDGNNPVHNYFHENHKTLEQNKAAWSMVSNFILSKQRIKVTLLEATVNNIHEEDKKERLFGLITIGTRHYKPAEIVFASEVTSPKLYEKLASEEPIDNRDVESGLLPLYNYNNNGETQEMNQTLFDGFVDASEESLNVTLHAYELDNDMRYNIHESLSTTREDLGGESIEILLKDGIYTVTTAEWEGKVKVERVDYN